MMTPDCPGVSGARAAGAAAGPTALRWRGWLESVTAVRDSKNPDGPVLAFPVSSWQAFVRK